MSGPQVIKRPPIYKLFLVQCLIAAMLVAGFALLRGSASALSALLGSLIFCVPQLYFSVKAFAENRPRAVHRIVTNFYAAESSKLVLVAMGFATVFIFYKSADYFAIFTCFVVLVATNPVITALLKAK